MNYGRLDSWATSDILPKLTIIVTIDFSRIIDFPAASIEARKEVMLRMQEGGQSNRKEGKRAQLAGENKIFISRNVV
jgi:hypothetical protein